MSPLGKIPALRDGDRAFSDSSVICEYLERLHPEPPVYPRTRTSTRARCGSRSMPTRRWSRSSAGRSSSRAWSAKRSWARSPTRRPSRRRSTRICRRASTTWRSSSAGPYLVGDRLTVGDVAVASTFVNLGHAGGARTRRAGRSSRGTSRRTTRGRRSRPSSRRSGASSDTADRWRPICTCASSCARSEFTHPAGCPGLDRRLSSRRATDRYRDHGAREDIARCHQSSIAQSRAACREES